MRIAIDGRTLTGRYTGDRTYWLNLIRAMVHQAPNDRFDVYSRAEIPEGDLPHSHNLTAYIVPAQNDRIWSMKALPNALRVNGADLLHVQYTIPGGCPCPVVTTIHDISYRLYPNWFPLKDRLILNLSTHVALRKAAAVITVSHSSREDMVRVYGKLADDVFAIPNGVGEEFLQRPPTSEQRAKSRNLVQAMLDIRTPFILSVGVLQPRKNLLMLAESYGKARSRYNLPHQLVFAGKMGWDTDQSLLRTAAERGSAGSASHLIFPGYVNDDMLRPLYEACDLFVHPALYEGFGLTPLEAMARGAATLVSNAPALPEIVGQAARIEPANDTDAWAKAIGEILTNTDELNRLRALGPAQAAKYTWETAAELTLGVYRNTISRGKIDNYAR